MVTMVDILPNAWWYTHRRRKMLMTAKVTHSKTVDSCAKQLTGVTSAQLDRLAPLKTVSRKQPINRQLSSDAKDAKRPRRVDCSVIGSKIDARPAANADIGISSTSHGACITPTWLQGLRNTAWAAVSGLLHTMTPFSSDRQHLNISSTSCVTWSKPVWNLSEIQQFPAELLTI